MPELAERKTEAAELEPKGKADGGKSGKNIRGGGCSSVANKQRSKAEFVSV